MGRAVLFIFFSFFFPNRDVTKLFSDVFVTKKSEKIRKNQKNVIFNSFD